MKLIKYIKRKRIDGLEYGVMEKVNKIMKLIVKLKMLCHHRLNLEMKLIKVYLKYSLKLIQKTIFKVKDRQIYFKKASYKIKIV
jgi:hypothetical protein